MSDFYEKFLKNNFFLRICLSLSLPLPHMIIECSVILWGNMSSKCMFVTYSSFIGSVRGISGDMFQSRNLFMLLSYSLMRFQVCFNNWGFPDESLKSVSGLEGNTNFSQYCPILFCWVISCFLNRTWVCWSWWVEVQKGRGQ